ncbi:hypothetical protein NY551_03570 [Curtobacterium flaccumfaciens pv. oortii]|uniref:hypothetical protein n=1 Tax=Curtobacterium flaccumfaciens TaxID=2035 RepID=UPI002659DDCF|nr:hypothetical protein [Curtobacterium flaccumfaciens]MCS5521809.1 hypothetical protein [Curtobacterium flaccumfaciens pv. oortii]
MPEAVIDDVPVDHLSNPPRRPLTDQTDGAAHHDSNRREMLVLTGHHVSDTFLQALLRGVTAGEVSATDAIAHALDYVDHHRSPTTTPAETGRRVAFSDGASGAEGGAVVDPHARELLLRVADGRMTADEALPFVIALVDDGRYVSDPASPTDPGYNALPVAYPIDLQPDVDEGLISSAEATRRVLSGYRVDQTLRAAVTQRDLDANRDFRDPELSDLVRDVIRGTRSEDDAVSRGLDRIRRHAR